MQSLQGVYDMHIHTYPDLTKRTYNDFELVDVANKVQAGGIVIKSHHGSTASRAILAKLYNKKCYPQSFLNIFGGISLNDEVGGLNASAVDYAVKLGAKVVWMPTICAKNDRIKHSKTGGLTLLDNDEKLLPQVQEILEIIKENNIVLATGHLSPKEIYILVKRARELKVEKILITHPEYWVVNLSLEQQIELVKLYDVILEKVYIQPLLSGQWVDNLQVDLQVIKKIGAKNIAIATDSGYYKNLSWEVMLKNYLNYLEANGISQADITQMSQTIQKYLLDVKD